MPITVPTDAYCTLAEAQQLLPNRKYDANSKPTFSQAEQTVKDVALQMNGILRGLGFSTPLTATDDVALLASINRLGAAALLEASTLIGVQGASTLATMYQERFDKMMKDMADGKFKFSTAGTPDVDNPDGNDDLDTGGDREDPIFKIAQSDRETQF